MKPILGFALPGLYRWHDQSNIQEKERHRNKTNRKTIRLELSGYRYRYCS
jgi:hypothetical protein